MASMTTSGARGDKRLPWVVVWVVAIYLGLQLLWMAKSLVLTAFLGVLFALAVSAGADQLRRIRIPRGIGAPLIVLSFIGLLGVFGTWVGPTVREQSNELRIKLPEALDKLETWIKSQGGGVMSTVLGVNDPPPILVEIQPTGRVTQPEAQSERRETLRERLLSQLSGAQRYFLPVLSSTLTVVAGLLLVLFLTIYIAVDPGLYRRGMLLLVPRDNRERADLILGAIATTLRRWLVTQLIAMVVIGVVTTVVLLMLEVRAAVPLGILAGMLEFIPTLGPIISALPAIAMGFVDSPEKALFVTIAYIGIQFLENHLLIPILMKEGVDLPPALTIVVQALMAMVFGFLGLLVAVPLLAMVMVFVKVGLGDPIPVAPASGEPATAAPDG